MIIGNSGVVLISLAVMVSAFGTLNASVMTGPRTIFAMAEDRLFFKQLAAVHPRFKTPYVSIIILSVLAVLFVLLIGNFNQLSDMFVIAIWPFYVAGVAAVYPLRRKLPHILRPYKTIGYPITPALFILAVLFLLGNAVFDDLKYYGVVPSTQKADSPSGALIVFGLILLGVPFYYIWQRFQSGKEE